MERVEFAAGGDRRRETATATAERHLSTRTLHRMCARCGAPARSWISTRTATGVTVTATCARCDRAPMPSTRKAGPVEARGSAPTDDAHGRLAGYAARFNSETVIGGLFRETIRPAAFRAAIAQGADVRALLNHDPNHILGRTASGTLRVAEDGIGLRYDVDLPATAAAVREAVARGDVTQSSFAFSVKTERWTKGEHGELPLRELLDVDLYDVSPVTYPAYRDTSVALMRERAPHADAALQRRLVATLARAAARVARDDANAARQRPPVNAPVRPPRPTPRPSPRRSVAEMSAHVARTAARIAADDAAAERARIAADRQHPFFAPARGTGRLTVPARHRRFSGPSL